MTCELLKIPHQRIQMDRLPLMQQLILKYVPYPLKGMHQHHRKFL